MAVYLSKMAATLVGPRHACKNISAINDIRHWMSRLCHLPLTCICVFVPDLFSLVIWTVAFRR